MATEIRRQLADVRLNFTRGIRQADDGIAGQFEGTIYEIGLNLNGDVEFRESSLESAQRIFRGAFMYVNHETREEFWSGSRDVSNRVGKVTRTEIGESENEKPALLGEFMLSNSSLGKDMQTLVSEGLITDVSIVATVKGFMDEETGIFIAEEFVDPEQENVYPPSVDLVAHGAAGGTIAVAQSYHLKERQAATQSVKALDSEEKPMPERISEQVDLAQIRQDIRAELEAEVRQSWLDKLDNLRQRYNAAIDIAMSARDTLGEMPQATQKRCLSLIQQQLVRFAEDGTNESDVRESINELIENERDYLTQISEFRPNGFSASNHSQPAVSEEKIKALSEQLDTI